jgi:hypothetical protein
MHARSRGGGTVAHGPEHCSRFEGPGDSGRPAPRASCTRAHTGPEDPSGTGREAGGDSRSARSGRPWAGLRPSNLGRPAPLKPGPARAPRASWPWRRTRIRVSRPKPCRAGEATLGAAPLFQVPAERIRVADDPSGPTRRRWPRSTPDRLGWSRAARLGSGPIRVSTVRVRGRPGSRSL